MGPHRRAAICAAALATSLAGCYRPAPLPDFAPRPAPGAPDPSAATSDPADCEAAVAAALARHPLVKAAEAGIPVQHVAANAADELPVPEIRARDDARNPGGMLRVGVRVDLPVPGAASARVEAARAEGRHVAAEADFVRAEVAAEVRIAFAELTFAREMRRIRERQRTLALARRSEAEALLRAGAATVLAEQSAALRVLRAEAALAEAIQEEESAAVAIRRWAGLPPAAGPSACAAPPETPTDLRTHPSVRAAVEEAQAADANAFAARRDAWAWPTFVELSWDHDDDDGDALLVATGLRLPWASGEADVAEAEATQAVAEARAALEEVEAEVAAARGALASARAALAHLEGAREVLGTVAALADRGEQGGADPREVIDLRERLEDYAADLAEARLRVDIAAAELRLALGLP